MKKYFLVAVLIFGSVTQTQAGIPVSIILDAPSMTNQIINYAQMLKEYAMMIQQLDEIRKQFKQMELEYTAMTGSRNLGDILNDPQFKQYLPDDWQSVYSRVRNKGYDGLSNSAKGIRDSSKIYDACANIINQTEKNICNALAVKPAQDQAFAMDAYAKSQDRVGQIEGLMREINRTNDPKAIAELNARIQAEQALIQNEQTKIALYRESASAEQRILLQQELEADKKIFSSKNHGVIVPPLEF
ncbi:P-type DNA transfer protein VirB5 [Candidatus Enterovibrio escicola]|uniref:P-type DNA transfer protein VirB5 n=1 Tax=Candidatus Enterovibrio escicola TaxID=1927127 RepID=UPI001237C0AA|nr:P-type DNA transfer protein VirB5 [Candidatus Enterovibrio escacola]